MLNDLSYQYIRNMFIYNSTHTSNETRGLTAGQWQARKHSIKHETLIPMCETTEGVPYIPLINYLVFWYNNPVLSMNTIHKKPNKTHKYIHRHDELTYYSDQFLDDTMVDLILIYSDGTSKNL